MWRNFLGIRRTSRDGFPVITEPIAAQGWWFWGAVGVSCGLWGLIIWGACTLANA